MQPSTISHPIPTVDGLLAATARVLIFATRSVRRIRALRIDWANIFDPQTGWQTAQLIDDEAGDTDAPQAAASADGRKAMAVWSQFDGSTYWNVLLKHFETVWRTEGATINLDHGWLAGALQVVTSRGRSARVVWIEGFRLERTVWVNYFKPQCRPVSGEVVGGRTHR